MLNQDIEIVAGRDGSQDLPHVHIPKGCFNVRLIGHQIREDMIVIAVVQIFRVGESARIVMNKPVPSSLKMEELVYAYQLLRARNRKRPQRQTVQHRENTDIDSDAQRDSHYSSYRKTWAAPQRANTKANILKQLLQPHNAPHFPRPDLCGCRA